MNDIEALEWCRGIVGKKHYWCDSCAPRDLCCGCEKLLSEAQMKELEGAERIELSEK